MPLSVSGYVYERLKPVLHVEFSVVSNAIQTIDKETAYLIIYCLNCIRRDRNSTYKTGLKFCLCVFTRNVCKDNIFHSAWSDDIIMFVFCKFIKFYNSYQTLKAVLNAC